MVSFILIKFIIFFISFRQKALEQEIDQNLSETCENIEPSTSPISKDDKFSFNLV